MLSVNATAKSIEEAGEHAALERASAAVGGDVLSSSSTASSSPNNVSSFPPPDGARTQDIVLRLALKGDSPQDIADTTRLTVVQVEKILSSSWAEKELEAIGKDDPENKDSVRNLLRIHAFSAITTIVSIIKDPKVAAATRLMAAKTVLESVMARPANDIEGKQKKKLPVSAEEISTLREDIERLEKLNKRVI